MIKKREAVILWDFTMRALFEKILVILCRILVFATSAQSFTFLILQIGRLRMEEVASRTKSGEERVLLEEKINWTKEVMLNLGSVYRDAGGGCVFLNAIFLSFFIVFFLMEILMSKNLIEYSNRGFILFLLEPLKEQERIQQRLNREIQKLLDSNINFTSTTAAVLQFSQSGGKTLNVDRQSDGDWNHNMLDLSMDEKQRLETSKQGYVTPLNNRQRRWSKNATLFDDANHTNENIIKISGSKRERVSLTHETKHNEFGLFEDLNSQEDHLKSLKTDTSTIWPVNRTLEWRKLEQFTWTYAYIGLLVVLMCFAQVALSQIQRFLVNKLGTKLTQLDKLALMEQHVVVYFGLDWCVRPWLLLSARVFDLQKLLSDIQKRLVKLTAKGKRIHTLYHDFVEDYHYYNTTKNISVNSMNNNLQLQKHRVSTLKILKQECDNEALDLYICFQLFLADAKLTKHLAHFWMDQRAWFTLIILVPTGFFVDQIAVGSFVALACAGLLMGVNVAITPCAMLQASFLQVTQRVWPLIANTIEIDLLNKEEFLQRKSSHIELNNQIFKPNNQPNLQQDCMAAYESTKIQSVAPLSLMTPHSAMLWRNLMADQHQVIENFRVLLFNCFSVDSNGLLRINFWVISAILLFCTYKRDLD